MFERFFVAIFTLVIFQSSAVADFASSRTWFEGLEENTRYQLQDSLVLTGDYLAIVDGTFGPSTYRALIGYGKKRRSTPDGTLSDTDLITLYKSADDSFLRFGFERFADSEFGLSTLIPTNIVQEQQSDQGTRRFADIDDTIVINTIVIPSDDANFRELYDYVSSSRPGHKVIYSTINDTRFVITGAKNNRFFYTLFYKTPQGSSGFEIQWDEQSRITGSIISTYMASHTMPFSSRTDETAFPQKPLPTEIAPESGLAEPRSNASEPTEFGGFFVLADLPGIAVLDGMITASTPLDFRRLIKARPQVTALILNSEGGSVAGALVLAHEIRDRKMATVIPDKFGCYSACAFVFFAGVERGVGGELGVHQIYSDNPDLNSAQLSISDILEALSEFGVDQGVLSVMLRTPPADMYIFTNDEIRKLGIATQFYD